MTPERLAHIRDLTENARTYTIAKDGTLAVVALHRRELLNCVDDLTRQLDDARRLALPAFTSAEGDESRLSHALNDTCEHCGTSLNEQACFRCGMNWPAPDPDTEAHISRLEEQAAGIRLAESP